MWFLRLPLCNFFVYLKAQHSDVFSTLWTFFFIWKACVYTKYKLGLKVHVKNILLRSQNDNMTILGLIDV